MAKSLRCLRPVSLSFSVTRTVGLASRVAETIKRIWRRRGRNETEKAEAGRGSLDEEREWVRCRVWREVAVDTAMIDDNGMVAINEEANEIEKGVTE